MDYLRSYFRYRTLTVNELTVYFFCFRRVNTFLFRRPFLYVQTVLGRSSNLFAATKRTSSIRLIGKNSVKAGRANLCCFGLFCNKIPEWPPKPEVFSADELLCR